jgi:thiol-disulfide isomerase/thioredoxin
MSGNTPDGRAQPSLSAVLWVAALSALAGFAAVYVTFARPDNAGRVPGAEKAAGGERAAPPAPGESVAQERKDADGKAAGRLNTGEMAAFVYKSAPEPVPEVSFSDGEGRPLTLAAFKGRTILLNLWATWCAPCRKEMPALDALQKALGSDKFEVVALSVDRNGADAARKFLAETKVEALRLYIDPTARATTALKAVGMPTTLLIDADGREIGRLVGPAEWNSQDARRLIAAAIR